MTRPLRLVTASDPPKGPHPMPERWSEAQRVEIMRYAMRKHYTLEELQFATESVRDWWEARRQLRADWPAVVKQAMRQGWALRGFQKEMERMKRGQINPRSGQFVISRTPITEERIGE